MNKKENLKIEYADISLLKKYERNAKIHTKQQVAKLVQSMKTFGVVTPILVGKEYEVIAGHCRLEALKELGYSKVPILKLEHLTEAQVKAYRLADNRIAEDAEYDKQLLKIELEELSLSDEFVITDTGFNIAEVDEIVIDDYTTEQSEPDKADNMNSLIDIPAKVKYGDIWLLGNHKILCGNALKPKSYENLLKGEKANLILTDAPYNVKINGHVGGKGKVKHKEFAMASGEMSDLEFEKFTKGFMNNLKDFSTDGSLHYLFIDWRSLKIFLNAGIEYYSCLKNICIWNKLRGGMGSC